MSVNRVILIGHTGADPTVRHLDNGAVVASFSLATTEKFTAKNGEKVTNTEWHNIVVWRGLAEVVEKYVKKGMQVYIEGRIKTRQWDDKDGNKRYTTEIYADNLQMLSSGQQPASDGHQSRPREQYTATGTPVSTFESQRPGEDDDLPF